MRRNRIAIAILTLAFLLATQPVQAATVGTAKGTKGQTLTVSNVKGLAPAGAWVTVTGKRFDETVGIYVSLCAIPAKGKKPTPCGGGVDMTGSKKATVWVSSNPPRYAVALTTPFKVGGGFTVKIKVGAKIDATHDCRKIKCAIVTRADHLAAEFRGADVIVPVTFAKK